ncbi:SEC-C motif domain-containing protein [Escherichia coli]|nr:SEC-C motif domain-containing protein [Escherichia coli]
MCLSFVPVVVLSSIAYVATLMCLVKRLHLIQNISCVSRYCAFVMQDADYLIKTWHPSCGAAALRAELIAGFAHTEWLGLTVFEHCWQDVDNIGFVSFVARFTEGGKTGAIIERSRFLKENGQWYYIDGTRPQFGRNDPCPCGSGKKFKKCCGQ